MGPDTLRLNKVYILEHPTYTPSIDSTENEAGKLKTPEIENELDAVGSITRGIQVSSNSSVSLQSSMYLKIKGNLNENYTVQGVLTDKTSPLQPIGNTRRLNDFERVMVEIDGPALNATIGDIDLQLQNGRFGKVQRSIEGISFYSKLQRGGVKGALGFSYGKYNLLQVQGKDGKQGPYRLIGKDGEKFIIILAGSEKIKLDDRLLVRGEDDDYIIDYNAAEIYFTQKHILSANSRISVEYEYVPDIYLASYSFGKQLISAEVSYGNRTDSPLFISAAWQDIRDDQNNPLGDIEADQLKQIFGDLESGTGATELSAITLDTLNGSYDLDTSGVLIYKGEQLGSYSVVFNFVGLERGQYRKELGTTSAFYVYDLEFGEYIPTQQYIAPQGLSVFSLSGHARRGAMEALFDVGLSQEVKNLYAHNKHQSQNIAWDMNIGVNRPMLELRIGDKLYESGYISHDALESLEYYRRWHLSARGMEEEHLRYGNFRFGQEASNRFKTSISQMERSGVLVGQQLEVDAKTDSKAPLYAEYTATLTNLDSSLSQYHSVMSRYTLGKFQMGLNMSIEDGSSSILHISNDHLISGFETKYHHSNDQQMLLRYEQRFDYRNSGNSSSFLSTNGIKDWTDHRQDWSADYIFANLLDTRGVFNMKYREHTSDSGAVKKYYLGKIQMNGNALNKAINFQENFLLDEEHIPKYDYHYIEVDTGYGDFSFDPAINDYIPIGGGRFIRQRLYSDREEQVRKFDNKTRVEFSTKGFGKSDKVALRSRIGYEKRLKEEVKSKETIQNQSSFSFNTELKTGQTKYFTGLKYAAKSNQNSSTLYNYGTENNTFNSQDFEGDFTWNNNNLSKAGVLLESRERELEYNSLAQEQWISIRPYLNHIQKISTQQKLEFDLKHSIVTDKLLEKEYLETFLELKHSLRIKRRGRIDQQLSLSNIKAEVSAIPYSVFSGRQPGDNWKYSINSRYTFSSMFQISMNYSLQKRGNNSSEQYLRVEGRTHF